MLVVSLITWWYGAGWLRLLQKVGGRIQGVLQFFSVGLLAGSLFAPFRQISAGRVQGPLGVQLRAWGDRLFSRFMGAIVRTLLIVCGLALTLIVALFGLLLIIVWPFLPLLPVGGVIITIVGSGQ